MTRALRSLNRFGMTYRPARLFGPFAFQPNTPTRSYEYPWAFSVISPRPGMRIIEIGGALSGLQFVLSAAGCEVHNVDPFVDYGGGAYTVSPEKSISRINRALGTDVMLHRSSLEEANLQGTFDIIYSISTLEHMAPSVIEATVIAARGLLAEGGRVVLTVDLFLDVVPFTSQTENRWGQNVSTAWIADLFHLELISGDPRELYGFPDFSVDHVLSNLSDFVSSDHLQLAQLMTLGGSR